MSIELYKGGAFLKNIITNTPSTVSFKWTVDLGLVPASDYSIRIRSTTNSALADLSDAYFSIVDAPAINPGSVTRLPDGRVQFTLTAPGASQVTVLASTNLLVWQALPAVPVISGSALFTDGTATNTPARFYRIRVP